MGSLGLSSNSISATPGPNPLTFPEKASESKSWPAAYNLNFWDTFVVTSLKTFQASSCILELFSPLSCVINNSKSSAALKT